MSSWLERASRIYTKSLTNEVSGLVGRRIARDLISESITTEEASRRLDFIKGSHELDYPTVINAVFAAILK